MVKPNPNRRSVMDVLMADDRFGELVTGLIVSDLGNALRDIDADSVTIFAPTDNAFRRAPPLLIQRLFEEDDKVLLRGSVAFSRHSCRVHVQERSVCPLN